MTRPSRTVSGWGRMTASSVTGGSWVEIVLTGPTCFSTCLHERRCESKNPKAKPTDKSLVQLFQWFYIDQSTWVTTSKSCEMPPMSVSKVAVSGIQSRPPQRWPHDISSAPGDSFSTRTGWHLDHANIHQQPVLSKFPEHTLINLEVLEHHTLLQKMSFW